MEITQKNRFVDNGDGTVTDVESSLMWSKGDSWLELQQYITWVEAQDFVQGKNKEKFAGYSDWRVPNAKEAKTLYVYESINTDKDGCEVHIDKSFSSGCGYTTWTSETRAAKQAMGFDFRDDYEYWLDKDHDSSSSNVRLVRSVGAENAMLITVDDGQGGVEEISRFVDNRDGTISDLQTNLMWSKLDSLLELDKWVSWDEAKVYVKELCRNKFAKFEDWRMPTKKEALSIYCPGHPTTDVYGDTVYLPEVFPAGCGVTTWTRTLNKNDERLAMRVFYYNGDFKWYKRGLRSHGIRPVRPIKG